MGKIDGEYKKLKFTKFEKFVKVNLGHESKAVVAWIISSSQTTTKHQSVSQ